MKISPQGHAQFPLANLTGMTTKLLKGVHIGDAIEANLFADPDI